MTQPARYVASWTAGMPLRLGKRAEFGQSAFAPAFTDAMGGYVFAARARFRHGVGLGLSANLSRDGGYTEPVYPLDQLAVMPSYLLYWEAWNPAWFALGHLGVPILVRGSTSAGAELGFGLGYRLLAGFGGVLQANLDLFGGAQSKLNPAFSLALGLFLDYEVLP